MTNRDVRTSWSSLRRKSQKLQWHNICYVMGVTFGGIRLPRHHILENNKIVLSRCMLRHKDDILWTSTSSPSRKKKKCKFFVIPYARGMKLCYILSWTIFRKSRLEINFFLALPSNPWDLLVPWSPTARSQ